MREQKDNFVYISHIRDAIKKIVEYTSCHDFDHFQDNEWDQSAIIRYFEVIGEATTRIDEVFKERHSDIEWRDLTDFRNFLIHDYIDIDVSILWDTMTMDIPPLQDKINDILSSEESSTS